MPDRRIATFTGKLVDVFDLQPEDVDIRDIAHSLSNMGRYGGHTRSFYSVAQHCVIMTRRLMELDAPPDECLACLLHDADEAYLIDLPNPIKREAQFQHFRDMAFRLQGTIERVFGLREAYYNDRIIPLDKEMVRHEAYYFFRPVHPDWAEELKPIPITFHPNLSPMNPIMAEKSFLSHFNEIQRRRVPSLHDVKR